MLSVFVAVEFIRRDANINEEMAKLPSYKSFNQLQGVVINHDKNTCYFIIPLASEPSVEKQIKQRHKGREVCELENSLVEIQSIGKRSNVI